MVENKIYINGLSIIAPGMVEPEKTLRILRGVQQWCAEPLPRLVPGSLPANERRRATPVIKLALQAMQPLLHSDDDLEKMATVFASSDGDLGNDDKICRALAKNEKAVSPTQFHNSVHNAPAGYWAIASSMRSASISLSAGNATFAAGLLDAAMQVLSEQQNVLLVAYDVVAPEPLNEKRKFEYSLSIALRLGLKSEAENAGHIQCSVSGANTVVTACQNDSLESLRTGNPVGAGLPLLEALARESVASISIPYVMGKRLQIEINKS
ncbi:MAG: beta-ketoacyl synthase chain length factor [Gammaproteobacteria bacterium]|nr:beta-ketoacyl synthase chain length factor [Gammaproteobacteria bacterium]